jgi:hypothetical protein
MLDELRIYLSTAVPVNLDDIDVSWRAYQIFEKKFTTSGSEAELSEFSNELAKIACLCIDGLRSPRTALPRPQYPTNDGIAITDHAILWSNQGVQDPNPAVLIEDKSIFVMGAHLPALLDMRSDLFRSTNQHNWEGAPSIVAKVPFFHLCCLQMLITLSGPEQLAWHATTDKSRYCKWGVVFAGKEFIIYHIMRVRVDAEPNDTCVMTHSNAIDITDTQSPYIAILVYMMLTFDDSHASLAAALHLTPPENAKIVEDHPEMDSRADVGGPGSGKLDYTRAPVPSEPHRQLIAPWPHLYCGPKTYA